MTAACVFLRPPRMMPIGANVAERRIELFDLAGCRLREPFLHETVAHAFASEPTRAYAHASFDTLARLATVHSRAPDAFVFHVGRCGSTLLANMLAGSPRQSVVREPDVVSHLMAGLLAGDATLDAVLDDAIRYSLAVAQQLAKARYATVKLSAWNVVLGGWLLARYPAARAVFVYRCPEDTVASLLHQPPAWQGLLDRPRAVQARFFPSLLGCETETPSALELYAHAFRSCARAALDLPRERVRFVSYQQLVSASEQTLGRVLAHLGDVTPREQLEGMAAARRVYSKDPSGMAEFRPRHEHSRTPLQREQLQAVRSITRAVWEELRQAGDSSAS